MRSKAEWDKIQTYYNHCNSCNHIWDNYCGENHLKGINGNWLKRPYAGCPLCQSQNITCFAYKDLKEVEFINPSVRFPRKYEIEEWVHSKRLDIPSVIGYHKPEFLKLKHLKLIK